jgi:hypothetical protein
MLQLQVGLAAVIASQLTNYEGGLSKLQSIIPNQIPYCTVC